MMGSLNAFNFISLNFDNLSFKIHKTIKFT